MLANKTAKHPLALILKRRKMRQIYFIILMLVKLVSAHPARNKPPHHACAKNAYPANYRAWVV